MERIFISSTSCLKATGLKDKFSVGLLTTQASLTVGKLICKLKSKSIPLDLSLASTLAATKLFLLMLISAVKSSSDDGCNIEIEDKNILIFQMFSPEQIPVFVWLAQNLSRLPYKAYPDQLSLCVLILPTDNLYTISRFEIFQPLI